MTTKNNFLPNTFKMHVFELHVKFASFWITHTQTNALYVIRHSYSKWSGQDFSTFIL